MSPARLPRPRTDTRSRCRRVFYVPIRDACLCCDILHCNVSIRRRNTSNSSRMRQSRCLTYREAVTLVWLSRARSRASEGNRWPRHCEARNHLAGIRNSVYQ